MNEVYRLVAAGYLNVRDIDSVMSDGLGMRYAFLGPLETFHLSSEGWLNYLERYGKAVYDVRQLFSFFKKSNSDIMLLTLFDHILHTHFQLSHTFGEIPRMGGQVAGDIAKQLEEMCPLNKIPERRAWRDNCLTLLSVLKKKH